MVDKFIFAGAPYSNSAPLIDHLAKVDDRVQVIYDHPANLVNLLKTEKADVALIPVTQFFRHPDLIMIKGLGVAADGAVKSVLLKCNAPVSEIKTMRCDPASATSNALANLLLEKHYSLKVQIQDPRLSGDCDAEVMIGDRALCSCPAPFGDIDLAAAWKQMTGFPFVFAVWAVQRDFHSITAVSEIAHMACDAGLMSIDKIAKRYADKQGNNVSFWKEYLLNSVHYRLKDRDLEGMELFKSLLNVASP